jgi:nicotinamidase/pyrazinamidase
MDVRLLIIDPQEDFCREGKPAVLDTKGNIIIPEILPGALFVPGAPDDCIRTAAMIDRLGKVIDKMYVTFDSHYQYQIFHPMFWKKGSGDAVMPFESIVHEDVKNGNIVPVDPNMLSWCLEYTKALDDGGRYPLIIWPYHCLIGTPGWNVDPVIMKAILDWEKLTYRTHRPITKGSNLKTEHYSAVKAEVEISTDGMTGLNQKGIIDPLEHADIVAIAGQARSHCVANTVRDIMTNFSDPEYIKKLYILEDAMSDVDGFQYLGQGFMTDFVKAGGNITTTDRFLA